MEIFDMHCHFDLFSANIFKKTKNLKDFGVNIISMTTTPKAFEVENEITSGCKNIKISLGLHPQLVDKRFSELDLVLQYLSKTKYIGEIGLDFSSQFYTSKDKQLHVLKEVIKECTSLKNKIISLHSVNSAKKVLDILEKHYCTDFCDCILHWYSGDIKQLKRAEEMGCYFSVNSKMLRNLNGQRLLKQMSKERILIESDAPFIDNVKNIKSLKNALVNTIIKLLEYRPDMTEEQLYKNSYQLYVCK